MRISEGFDAFALAAIAGVLDLSRPQGYFAIEAENAMNVAVLGASNKPERYSHQAVVLLAHKGHAVYPIHPALADIEGRRVFPRLADVPVPLHTVSMYVSPTHSTQLAHDILAVRPARVVFNPGTENPDLEARLAAAGIQVVHACTLVLLRTGQFGD